MKKKKKKKKKNKNKNKNNKKKLCTAAPQALQSTLYGRESTAGEPLCQQATLSKSIASTLPLAD